MNEATGPIPKAWRATVAAILRKGNLGKVFIRQRALQNWRDIFPDEFFEYSLREALAHALDDDGLNGKSYAMDEPGETYGFIFQHRSRTLYAKLNLTEPDKVVIVYSAHRPLHEEELT
jgi:hypothetical protein